MGRAYRIERELGGGGSSRVFIAEETAIGRQVVVTVLPPELMEGVSVERFNREILLVDGIRATDIAMAMAMTPTFTPGGAPVTAQGAMAGRCTGDNDAQGRTTRELVPYSTRRILCTCGAFVFVIPVFMGMHAYGVGLFGSLVARGAQLAESKPQVALDEFRRADVG